jgi:hypothetical protein
MVGGERRTGKAEVTRRRRRLDWIALHRIESTVTSTPKKKGLRCLVLNIKMKGINLSVSMIIKKEFMHG